MSSSSAHHRFTGQGVVVTGGAAGIGAAIAAAFLAEGATVVILDVSRGPLPPAIAAATLVPCNVADEAIVAAAIDTALALFGGRISVLVNNAAAFIYGDVTTVTSAAWDTALSVNVKGYANTMKAVIPHMRRAGGGAIVNVSSISAFTGQTSFVPYSVTKAAVLQMTRCVAADEGVHNIRVNAVCPGPILTDATAAHAAGLGKSVEAVVGELTGHLVIKRMGRPEEVAKAVCFLASEDASFTTGSHLMVDGGYLIC